MEIPFKTVKTSALYGLVLAGGESRRMNRDKALINYHGYPQYEYVYRLLSPYCEKVWISCKTADQYPLNCISDKEQFSGIGPCAGLLSAFESYPASWVVVAIDYPFFGQKEVEWLCRERNALAPATVCFNATTGFFEPFLGIYEGYFFSQINALLPEAGYSLQKILSAFPVKKIIPDDYKVIRSINTLEEYQALK